MVKSVLELKWYKFFTNHTCWLLSVDHTGKKQFFTSSLNSVQVNWKPPNTQQIVIFEACKKGKWRHAIKNEIFPPKIHLCSLQRRHREQLQWKFGTLTISHVPSLSKFEFLNLPGIVLLVTFTLREHLRDFSSWTGSMGEKSVFISLIPGLAGLFVQDWWYQKSECIQYVLVYISM